MTGETIETITRVLLVALIAILLYVLYNRLLKALGKGKFQKSYPVLNEHEVLPDTKILLINFIIPKTTNAKLEVLDTHDNLISVLLDESLEPKNYTIKLDYSEMISGKYVYKLSTENQSSYKYFKVR